MILSLLACITGTIEVGETVSDDTGTTATDSGDADTDTDTDTDTDIEACGEYPDQPLYSDSPVEGERWNPYWLTISFAATIGDDDLHDMQWSGVPVSSYLTFDVYSEDTSEQCAIVYDLSESTLAVQPWSSDTGGLLFDSYDLVLRDGFTDCRPVSLDRWGTDDIREILEQHGWGFALGEAVRVEEYIRERVDDFAVWEPYLMGGYVMTSAYSLDTAFEVSYALSVEADCGVAQTDFEGNPVYREAVVEGPLPDSIGYASGLYGLTLENLR